MKSLTALALVTVTLIGCETTTPSRKAEGPGGVPDHTFAKVSVSLKGCTSCGPCRSTIRQAVQSSSKAHRFAFGDGYKSATMFYTSPGEIPLQHIYDVILASPLNDVSIIEVAIETSGTLEISNDAAYLVIPQTGQKLRAQMDPMDTRWNGKTVHVRAVVEGLDTGDGAFLAIKDIHE